MKKKKTGSAILRLALSSNKADLIDEPLLPVVVPRTHAPQTTVLLEQRQRCRKIFIEIGRHFQIVFNNNHLISGGCDKFLLIDITNVQFNLLSNLLIDIDGKTQGRGQIFFEFFTLKNAFLCHFKGFFFNQSAGVFLFPFSFFPFSLYSSISLSRFPFFPSSHIPLPTTIVL